MKRLLLCFMCLGLLSLQACTSTPPAPKNPNNPVVALDTSMGKIYLEIWDDKAPITGKNFMVYVDEKHFDGTIFHRVIEDFMIQGGGFTPGMKGEKETHDPIQNESSKTPPNKRGTIAMARTDDPDSATAQFFINVKDNPSLDAGFRKPGYAVFGEVLEGMDVVDAIRRVRTGKSRGQSDVPVDEVLILSARRVETKK